MVLFDSRSILPQGNVNYSLVGLTADQAKKDKIEAATSTEIPSVDADIDKCNELLDDERLTCWEDLDKKLMEEVVPWVPYLDALERRHHRTRSDEVRVRPVLRRGCVLAAGGRRVEAAVTTR